MIQMNSESVLSQKKEKKEVKKSNSNFNYEECKKHYLNTILDKELDSREIILRILPFSVDEPIPFKKIHVHNVKVYNKDGQKKWQKFMCPTFFKKADKCPFCEIADEARNRMYAETDENKKKKSYKDVLFMNEAKNYWAVRCIERGKENDGVKYWFFPDKKKDGVWDKISSIYETRKKRGTDIFDLTNGKDLIITLKRDDRGYPDYQITDDDKLTPLSQSEAEMEKWVYDTWKFEDVHPAKSYEYLSILADGGYPVWSQDLKSLVDKYKLADMLKEAKEEEIKENLMPQEKDFSSFTVDTGYTKTNESAEVKTNQVEDKAFSSLTSKPTVAEVEDDGLPF